MTRSQVTGLLSIFGMATIQAGCAATQRLELSESLVNVDQITIRGDVGVTEVVPGSRARIIQELNAPEGTIERSVQVVDGHLTVETRCKTPVLCSVNSRVQVPEGIAVRVELDEGEVWATGIGDLDVELGSGTADLDTLGSLGAHVGHGRIRAESAQGQRVRLTVGQGDIELLVPRTPWRVDVQSQESQILGVLRDEQASGSLELIAPSGRVRVRAIGPAADSGSAFAP